MTERLETGVLKADGDWPGIFIRGDEAPAPSYKDGKQKGASFVPRPSPRFQDNSSAWAVKHRYHSAVFCKTLRTCLWEILSSDSKLLLTCRIIFESFRLAWHEDGARGEQGARIDRG
jgi:hypothetical protein